MNITKMFWWILNNYLSLKLYYFKNANVACWNGIFIYMISVIDIDILPVFLKVYFVMNRCVIKYVYIFCEVH